MEKEDSIGIITVKLLYIYIPFYFTPLCPSEFSQECLIEEVDHSVSIIVNGFKYHKTQGFYFQMHMSLKIYKFIFNHLSIITYSGHESKGYISG